jgi:hypothetical protein
MLAHLGVIELQVLNQMLRLDEERRDDAGPGDEVVRGARHGSSTTLYPLASSFSLGRATRYNTAPFYSRDTGAPFPMTTRPQYHLIFPLPRVGSSRRVSTYSRGEWRHCAARSGVAENMGVK